MGKTSVVLHSGENSGGSRALSVADGIRRLNRRERKRNEGRYLIKERLTQKISENNLDYDGRSNSIESEILTADENMEEMLVPFIKAIGKNEVAAFGIHRLAILSEYIDTCFSLMHLISRGLIDSDYLIKSKASDSLGISSYESRIAFIQDESKLYGGFTLLTLASLYGRVAIVTKLLKSGADPTIRNNGQTKYDRNVSNKVLKCIANEMFPVSYAGWAVRCTIAMRLKYHQNHRSNPSLSNKCQYCRAPFESTSLLYWGGDDECNDEVSCCRHIFCEQCWWLHWSLSVNKTDNLTCPICSGSWPIIGQSNSDIWSENDLSNSIDDISIRERKEACFQRFLQLPATANDLKRSPKKNKKACYDKTWYDVIARSIGKTQDVRMDKFLSAITRGSERYVRGCLEFGVDIDSTNEYGQSSLYIAAWRGNLKVVKMLLSYGANIWQKANGDLTIFDVAKSNNHNDILDLLNTYIKVGVKRSSHSVNASKLLSQAAAISVEEEPITRVIIDINSDHPGAGSIIIDNALPDSLIEALMILSQKLPIDLGKKVLKEETTDAVSLCSTRSYFCDAEGLLVNAIKKNIQPTLIGGNLNDNVIIFPHMRFLTYEQAGANLARHIDLCRIDDSGNRSSHSFLLYLHDCEQGGETLLLQDIQSSTQILGSVKPRKGRLLLFPHICPHEGNAVISTPKVLIRGEVMITKR